MATGRTNSGEVTITQSGGGSGSSDVQPRKVEYIWMHPRSVFKIEKDFLGWLNSGYEISVQYRNVTEYLNMSANYQCVLGCKVKSSSSISSKTAYGYMLGNSIPVSSTSIGKNGFYFSANLSSSSATSIGTYRNNKVLLKIDNDTIKYKNSYSFDYSYNTWTEPSSFSSITLPDGITFSSLLTIYSAYDNFRSFFGYGSLINNDDSFASCDAIIGNLKVTNPSNNDTVIANYETWINNNTPYLKETVSNTTVSAIFDSSLSESYKFNGWIEYVTDENGIVTRKEVPPKKYVQTRGNIIYVDEIEDENNNR